MTIFAGDGFGPRFAAGTNSWVEPARNRNNTLQCSCPATVSAFTETRTGPFSPSLPTRFTCSCKSVEFVQYGWNGDEAGPFFQNRARPPLNGTADPHPLPCSPTELDRARPSPPRAVKGATFSNGCARKVERSIRRRFARPLRGSAERKNDDDDGRTIF